MKKALLLVFLVVKFGTINASDVIVRSSPGSGEYNFPIEVYLMSNYKDAKIFYYTDGEGRMDKIKEYKTPILLKEDTTIDFYAVAKDYKESLVQTSVYTFKYPQEIDILEKNGKIALKNNSLEIQNIGYRKIEGNNLDYEISPNTFVGANEIYEIDYTPKYNEKLTLYSPDKKVIKNFTFKGYKKENYKPETKKLEAKEKSEVNDSGLSLTKSGEIEQINAKEEIGSRAAQINTTITNHVREEGSFLNGSMKASLIDSKLQNNKLTKNDTKANKSYGMYIIFSIFATTLLYSVGLFLKKSQKFTKIKEIINKIGKK